jgi:TolA-binding protein
MDKPHVFQDKFIYSYHGGDKRLKNKHVLLTSLMIFYGASITGCTHHAASVQSAATTSASSQVASTSTATNARTSEVTENDQAFLRNLQESITRAQTIIKELGLIIEEMQQTDEFVEAQENMETAKQEILYLWNHIHNETAPDTPRLQKMKADYEAILIEYREGITMQIEGMKAGDGAQVIKGLETAQKAERDLSHFGGQK